MGTLQLQGAASVCPGQDSPLSVGPLGHAGHAQTPEPGTSAVGEERPAGWRPGGPPRTCAQGKGAVFTAAVNTHLLQHGLNHLDRKTSHLESGLKMLCFSC